jgi:hypothetical protein
VSVGTLARFDNNWGKKSTTPIEGKIYPYVMGEIGSGWNPYWQQFDNGTADPVALDYVLRNLDMDFR